MGSIVILGLGPGRLGLITLESWEILQKANPLLLRTAVHPTAADLRERGIPFSSYDGFYEEAKDFSTLYRRIAEDVLARAAAGEDVVYAVPGSPLVAERTVVLLREMAREAGISLSILPGMSFLEVLYTRLGIDPLEGVAIVDAMDAECLAGCGSLSMVVTQVYDQRVASEAKLTLLDIFPDEHRVTYIHHLALPEEAIRQIPLYEIDRQVDLDHLTSIFIPRCPFFLGTP